MVRPPNRYIISEEERARWEEAPLPNPPNMEALREAVATLMPPASVIPLLEAAFGENSPAVKTVRFALNPERVDEDSPGEIFSTYVRQLNQYAHWFTVVDEIQWIETS